jgi:uncharacterized protein (UPF0333 family)
MKRTGVYMNKNMSKGQVSTEYLVILAVVLVVALVVVYLVGGFSSLGAGSLQTQSQNYWGSMSPLSIITVKAASTNMSLEIVNNDLQQLTLTSITIGGTSVFSTATTFNSGQDTIVTVTLPATCGAQGSPFTYNNVVLLYTKGGITGIAEAGTKPLVGKCS